MPRHLLAVISHIFHTILNIHHLRITRRLVILALLRRMPCLIIIFHLQIILLIDFLIAIDCSPDHVSPGKCCFTVLLVQVDLEVRAEILSNRLNEQVVLLLEVALSIFLLFFLCLLRASVHVDQVLNLLELRVVVAKLILLDDLGRQFVFHWLAAFRDWTLGSSPCPVRQLIILNFNLHDLLILSLLIALTRLHLRLWRVNSIDLSTCILNLSQHI